MAASPYYYTIYNDPETQETEDSQLAFEFVEYLVTSKIKEWGYEGYYADRDAIPGRNIFDEHSRLVDEVKKIIVVITPEVRDNWWAKYSQQNAFKTLSDRGNLHKIICIAVNISDNKALGELNINRPLHINGRRRDEWERNTTTWDRLKMVLNMTTPESVIGDGSSLHKMAFDGRLLKLEEKVISDLEKNCTLDVGSGSFGEVYASTSVLSGFDLRVALKKIQHSKANDKSIRREKLASRIMHPFILPLLAVENQQNGNQQEIWFVSPYCENGDLNTALKFDHDASSQENVKMNNVRRVKILLQIALAIEYIHTSINDVREAILHKDIASKNVVLDGHYNARLIDFGLAREKGDETTQNLSGRLPYMTPGMRQGRAHATESSDYYAYGVVIREMLTGLKPDNDCDYLDQMESERILSKLQKYVWPEEATPKEKKLDSIAQACLQAETWDASKFKTEVVKNLNDILTKYNGKILDIPEDNERCHICLINQQATESSMKQEHDNCNVNIKLCVSCEKNSFLNPVTCYCGVALKPDIGYRWGALLVAGNDEKDKTLAAAFTKDMQQMKQLITSRAPLIMGIPDDKVRIVVPKKPGSPRDGEEPTIVSKVEKALLYFSKEAEVDTLLIYFSCHGEKKDEYGDNRFQFGSASDCMSHDEFEKKLEELGNIRRLIIFLDCCYPPLIKHRKCEKFIQINACKSHERARSRDDNGMFTKYLIQGLKAKSEGKICPDNCKDCKTYWEKGNDYISLQSLFDYVNNHLKDKAPTPDWQGRSWKNIAFYSDEIVEIEFTSTKDVGTKRVPLGYLLDMNQIKENLRQQFGKDGVTVSISKDTYRNDEQFQNCDTLEKVMLAWVQRQPLHVTFEESTNQS